MHGKKIIPLILLTILASAPLMVPAWFMMSRHLIRLEMLEKMEEQNLVSVEILATEFQWHEEGREIIINGKMFDVKSITLSHGVYFIKGLFDEKETELKQAFQDQQEEQDGKTLNAQQLVELITTSAEINNALPTLAAAGLFRSARAEYYNSLFPQYIGAIAVPPPDRCTQF
jgi:hypothetical protein